jgi:hypothetical protein
MRERLRTIGVVLALLTLCGCGSTSGHAGQTSATAPDPVTESSTCVEWAHAPTAQQDGFARLIAPGLSIPAKYQGGEAAEAYAYGVIAGRCHQAETSGDAGQVTLGKLLNIEPSSSGSFSEAQPSEDFLKPLPAVTIGSEQAGRWSVVLDSSVRSAQPLSGSAPFGPSDRLLKVRISATYLTPGPPGVIGFAEHGIQLDELPQDFGFTHVPVDAEEGSPEAERCTPGEIKDLCDVVDSGTGDSGFVLYAEGNDSPGGTIFQDELGEVEPNQSESFWLVGHLSEHVQPSHVVLAIDGKPLSAIVKT